MSCSGSLEAAPLATTIYNPFSVASVWSLTKTLSPVTNVTASSVVASVYINDGSNDIYLVKDAPIPAGSALQVLDGGAKFVVQSGDALKVISDTASSLDVWVSTVDAIST